MPKLLLALAILALIACSSAPSTGAGDETMTLRITAGDAQESRIANAALPTPLAVLASNAAGRALSNAAIRWSTTDGTIIGDATTDATGTARATWRLAPRAGAQTAIAHSGLKDSVVFTARLLASDVRLTRDTLTLRATERARLEWLLLDAAGTVIDGSAWRWTSANESVATVAASGEIVAKSDGVVEMTADGAALGITRIARATVVVGVPIAGRVSTLDGSAPGAMRVYVRTAGGTDSADVGVDGRFALRARSAALRDSTEIVVDAVDCATRKWFPALWRWKPGAPPPPFDVLLLPRTWRLANGTDVAISLNVALGAGIPEPPAGASWYDRNALYDRVAPLGAAPSMEAFADDELPIPVFFDRAHSNHPIVADDSIEFWRAADALTVAVGRPLVRPADARTVGPPAIAVVVDSVLLQGLAFSTWTTACPADRAPCAGVLDRTDATMHFSGRTRRVRERALVQHELSHVLGLGHTCFWTSVMFAQMDVVTSQVVGPSCARYFQGGPWPGGFIDRAAESTPRDLAYLAVYLQVASAVRRLGPVHALYAAYLGERQIVLGFDDGDTSRSIAP